MQFVNAGKVSSGWRITVIFLRDMSADFEKLFAVPWRRRITHATFLEIVYGYAFDIPAAETARQAKVGVQTVGAVYRDLHKCVLETDELNHRVADRRQIDVYHAERRALHRGWRLTDDASHRLESERRLAVRSAGPFWLYFVILEAVYRADRR